MSRLVAMLGLFALLRQLLISIPPLFVLFDYNPPKHSWVLLASAIFVMVLVCIASLMAVAFLWFRADEFGGSSGVEEASEGVVVDGPGVRSAIVFGLGLYFVVLGFIYVIPLVQEWAAAGELRPYVGRDLRFNLIEDCLQIAFGIGCIVISRKPGISIAPQRLPETISIKSASLHAPTTKTTKNKAGASVAADAPCHVGTNPNDRRVHPFRRLPRTAFR